MQFTDRQQAGQDLGQALLGYAGVGALVLALPRGGVPVAFEVARALEAPLDVWVVRKLGAPSRPELGVGAIAEGPALHLDRDLAHLLGVREPELQAVIRRETDELRRRVELYRGGRPPPEVRGRTVILVDDGIATGGTTRAAIAGVRARGAAAVVVAAPVASPQAVASLRPLVEDLVCPHQPIELRSIGDWYEDFRQVPDAAVRRLLDLGRLGREGAFQGETERGEARR